MLTSELSAKEQKIIDAAMAVFMRYGIKKTTMGDIAAEAGISRQTLYASYANKEDIMTVALKVAIIQKIASIQLAWGGLEAIEAKLDAFFDVVIFQCFDQLRAMPNYEDFYTGFNEAGRLELAKGTKAKCALLETLFMPYQKRLLEKDQTPFELAEFISLSAESFIQTAEDKQHLKRLIKSLKFSVLALID